MEGDYLEGEYAAEMAAGSMSLDAADEEVSDIRDWVSIGVGSGPQIGVQKGL